MKKIILISLGVVILVFGGLAAYVSMIDWNKHKDRMSRQVSEVIGKKVEFAGNLEVSYFPPVISAQSVKVINPQTNDTIAQIPQLKTDVSLLSLIKGAPDIQTLHLVDADLWVTFDEEGRNNWVQQTASPDFVENNGFLMKTINLSNAKLHFNDKSHNIQFDLTDFTAEITASSVTGPYRLDGNFMKGNERYGTAFQIDAISQFNDTNLMFVVLHQGSESYVRYDGPYNMGTNTFKGFAKGDFKRTSDFINAVAGEKVLPDVYNVPLQFSTDVSIDGKNIELAHFSVVFSQLMVGSGEVVISQTPKENGQIPVTVKYQLRDFDFRPLWAQIEEKFAQYQKGEKFTPNWPYDVDYDISSVRVIISDKPEGVLENVSIKGQIRNDGFSVDDFYAGCAGNIVLNATGNLVANEGVPLCSLNIVADGRNFRSMINSFGFNLEAPSQGAYQTGKIKASAQITPSSIQVEELTSTIDKSSVKMSADVALLTNAYNIVINADRLNLDNYIFAPGQNMPKDLETTLKFDLNGLAKLQNKSVHLQADVDEAIFRGAAIKKLQLDAQYADGALNIVKATADDVLGTSADITAIVENISSSKPKINEMSFNLKSQDLLPLIKKLALPLPEWPLFSQNNTTVNGNLSGDFDHITLKVNAMAGTDSFDYDGTIQGSDDKTQYNGDFVVKTTRMEQLLNKINMTGADKSLRGAFNGKAHIRGRKDNFALEEMEFQLGPSQYVGNITVKKDKSCAIKGEVSVNELNWAQFIKTQKDKNTVPPAASTSGDTFIPKPNLSKDPFDFSIYRDLDLDIALTTQKSIYGDFSAENLKLRIIGSNGTILLQNITASSPNASVVGNVKIDYTQTPKMAGTLNWSKVKVNELGGSIYALSTDDMALSLDFETSAQSLDNIVSGLSGTARVKTSNLKIKGIDLSAIEKDLAERDRSKGLFQMVQENLQKGATTFYPINVAGAIKNGVLSLESIALKNEHTNAVLSGKVNLKDWRIDTTVNVKYPLLTDTPAYSFEMTTALNKPIIDISVGDIAHKYDAYWDKLAKEEKAERDKVKQAKDEYAGQVKLQAINLGNRAEKISASAKSYADKKIVESTIFKYQAKIDRLTEMYRSLQETQGKLSQQDINNEEISQIERQLQITRQEIDIIEGEVKEYLAADINQIMEAGRVEMDKEYKNCADGMEKFESQLNTAAEKLEKINSKRYLSDNKDINREHDMALNNINTAGGIYSDYNAQYEKIKAMPNNTGKVDEIVNLNEMLQQMNNQCVLIADAQKSAEEMITKIVNERQAVYDKEQRAAEEKRLAEAAEDANNLLAEKKSQEPVEQVAIVSKNKNVDDGKKNETADDGKSAVEAKVPANEGKKEEVKADEKAEMKPAEPLIKQVSPAGTGAPSGIIIRSYDVPKAEPETPKTGSGILRPVEGAIQKPSGTIIVK